MSAASQAPMITPSGPLLRVTKLPSDEWRVAVAGLPPSDYPTLEEASAEAEAYLAGHGRGGEIVVGDEPD